MSGTWERVDWIPAGQRGLLARTRREAQRGLDFRSPGLSLIAAAVTFVAFGAVWLSVRGQHPYKGPTAVALVVLYAVVLIRIGTRRRTPIAAPTPASGALGEPAPRGGSGLGGGVGRRVRVDGSTGRRRGE